MSSYPLTATTHDNYRGFCESVRHFILTEKASLTAFNISISYQTISSFYLCISITISLCSDISATINNENPILENEVSKAMSGRSNAAWHLQSNPIKLQGQSQINGGKSEEVHRIYILNISI